MRGYTFIIASLATGGILALNGCGKENKAENAEQTLAKKMKKNGVEEDISKLSYIELGNRQDEAMQKKQHKNAELYLREMIRRQSLIKSPPPLEVGMLYYMLANATRNKNYYNKARPYLKKVLKQEQERTNPQKIEIASFTLMLGKIALETGRLEQAINDSEKAKDLLIQLKSGKLSMLTVYSQLADAYCRNDQPEKALKYIQYSRDISRQLYGEKSYSTACCISLHAVILYDLKKKKQAITLLEQAHDIFLETREKNDKATINAAKMLAKWKKNKN